MPELPRSGTMATNPILRMIHPLDEFYAAAGQSLPEILLVSGNAVDEPYKTLLVHQTDMTPTLEKFHGSPVHLNVLGRRTSGNFYSREVILLLDSNNRPVEFGAIKINLDLFQPKAREAILQEHLPVGHILQLYKIEHASQPSAYLRLKSDDLINGLFGMSRSHTLFGRRNTLFNPEGKALAEIVEILPQHIA